MDWNSWIRINWAALASGSKIVVPPTLYSLEEGGFSPTTMASPEGQVADWALSMSDRSRLHVHVYADGRRIVHRDQHDPALGLLDMVAHLVKETPVGLVAFVGGALWLASLSEG
jgi:hypothetical protein